MGNCKFANELNRLCKSSSDSIDNTEKFDDFKKYMHVTRTAEEDLKAILRNVNAGNKKTLVLLCGSAGDGKSHLLSYLKNSDEEHLIENYTIFNDATESSAPSKTAIETLNELLEPFKDNQLEIPGRNVILAINLGVLSNFVESEYGNEFSKLRSYVEDSNILTTQVNNNDFDENGHFQHVSFSDYHMYSLTKDGIHAGYIEDIMKKVFSAVDENRFYQSYIKDCESCPLSKKCPVKMNYEFLMEEKRQVYVSQLLVETIIKDKVILTTREILNFIYNIVVSQEFSFADIQKSLVDDSTYLKKFLKQITPALLFDSTDVTVLMNMLNKYDPLRMRSERTDEIAISYYVSSDISKEIKKAFKDMFSHAITLEILNQTQSDEMVDYISLAKLANEPGMDSVIAAEVKKAEETYCSYVGDYKGFSDIQYPLAGTETDKAVNHLFKCVYQQFLNTDRKRANQFYNEKFTEFCKSRWVKNRKKSGLVLNLTERDVIFLTKICLRAEEKIRLNDLFKEYEKRGIYLDGTSKEYLQEFFTKLNLIDKKSDSGDAQYVKRIL